MKFVSLLAIIFLACRGRAQDETENFEEALELMTESFLSLQERYDELADRVTSLARQTMMQQFSVEERVRSEGDSGIKIIRGRNKGPQNYYGSTHNAAAFMSIHNHPNARGTVGLGEFIAVLNGVEFRTRHNDYKLVMPSTTSKEYGAVEELPFPEVPPAVSQLTDPEAQIDEMIKWFEAFAEQNTTERDYRPYFKPALCYLEGAWTLSEGTTIDEPFQSDRHFIEASDWFDLQDKIRYTSYTGSKSRDENIAYLPTAIMSVNETSGVPNYAQWNYRILCHPTNRDIPFSYLIVVDDMSFRYPRGQDFDWLRSQRGARFRLYEEETAKFTKYSLLDEIMYEIPGRDNIPGNLSETAYGDEQFRMGVEGAVPLQSGYYHRWFKFSKPGAMGETEVPRHFNDENGWVAQTTQSRIAPMGIERCSKQKVDGKNRQVCETVYSRFTWAVPLEIIYMTPLVSWNPYNIPYREGDDAKNIVTEGGRNGKNEAKAFNGTYLKAFYNTPSRFFTGTVEESSNADTGGKGAVWVLDESGTPRAMAASGTRISLPNVGSVKNLRIRYPIAPIHGEGSSVWKEVNAVREWVKEMLDEPTTEKKSYTFEMSTTSQDPPGLHTHSFLLSSDDYFSVMNNGTTVEVSTTQNNGHNHNLVIAYNKNKFVYTSCNGQSRCADGHATRVYPQEA